MTLTSKKTQSTSKDRHWYDVPGADLALLSEMKASSADLKRFRRENEWLEERVSRPRLDPAEDRLLNRALGLTVEAPMPQFKGPNTLQKQQSIAKKTTTMATGTAATAAVTEAEERSNLDSPSLDSSSTTTVEQQPHRQHLPPDQPGSPRLINTYGTVRLSTDSRIAFSQLKTNLIAETEEQTRLLCDQEILRTAVDATRALIQQKSEAMAQAESRILEFQKRQPEVEAELQKVIRIEKAYETMMNLKQSQMDQEVEQLQNVLSLLVDQDSTKV
ncbi:hypothetical protein BG004_004221 [Podila humilis]|nr:hypothetical protein BG004_004221 [Podila humilis]